MKETKKYLHEVETAMRTLPRQIPPGFAENYVGGGQSQLEYLGLKVPQVRGALKRGFSFSKLDDETVADIWDSIWHKSQIFEVMSLALTWYSLKKDKPLVLNRWSALKKWSRQIDNWGHSDGLSAIYARLLEETPSSVYPTLVQWGGSNLPWLRRLSVVSLIYFYSSRTRVPPASNIFPLIKKQLNYEHMYVQKGVGWTLREAGRAYPAETRRFIDAHLHRLSSIAFTIAVERWTDKDKKPLKTARAAHRAASKK